MFDLIIGYGCLTVAAILYIGDKFINDVRYHRYRKNKMTNN